MSKFKVGDIVKAIRKGKDKYAITNTKMTAGLVEKLLEDNEIAVKVLKHENPEYIGSSWDVKEKDFELAEPAEPVEEESDEIRKLKKIAKKFKKLVLKVSCIECRNIEDRSKCPLREVAFILGNDEITICDILNNTFLNIPLVGDEDE